MTNIDPFSLNFKANGLWQRLYEIHGGNEQRANEWWDTPIPHPPFNLRTPRELMTENEWNSVRLFIEKQNPASTARFDYGPMSYYNSDRDGKMPDLQPHRNKYTPRGRRQKRIAGLPEDPLGHD